MATIDDEIAAIREAISTGAKKIRFKDGSVEKEVDYPSFKDLLDRLAWLEAQKADVGGRRRTVILARL